MHSYHVSQELFKIHISDLSNFSITGHGSGAKDQVGDAMDGLLKAAGDGQLDVNFGQRQLRVAAIRLKENPEYLCEPGSVSQGDKCGECVCE